TWSSADGRYTNFQINYANSKPEKFGDNAKQSERLELGSGLTIDTGPGKCRDFLNWDAPNSVRNYGEDATPDLRIGTSGTLSQSTSPVLCLREQEGTDLRRYEVNRVTARILPAD
ncbi:MAG TPA: hypothetical protein VMY39_05795, partial [Planctomycetota bacterium]|nr:hypothetical protein [Planctomycetota bacterium]